MVLLSLERLWYFCGGSFRLDKLSQEKLRCPILATSFVTFISTAARPCEYGMVENLVCYLLVSVGGTGSNEPTLWKKMLRGKFFGYRHFEIFSG